MPNVILITTDHQRFDNVAAHGNEVIQTPHLDRLVREGVSLRSCYVQNPVCMPSRASIWTGRYPHNHHVMNNGIPLAKTEWNLAHHFSHHGYRTVNVGKLHFLPHYGPDRDHTKNDIAYAGYGYDVNELSDEPGCYDDAYIDWVKREAPSHLEAMRVPAPTGPRGHFDAWTLEGPEEFSHAAWVCRRGCDHLRDLANRDKPFFMSLGIYAPHPPLNPSARWRDLYRQADVPMPNCTEADRKNSRWADRPLEQWRQGVRDFYAMCSMLDHWIGEVLKTLEETGLADDTIVVFMSDHGDALSEYGQWNKGAPGLDSMLHVPCVLRWPKGLPGGHRPQALVEAIDVYPTLCELCGIDVPHGVDGRSAATLCKNETDAHRDSILVESHDTMNGWSCKVIRTQTHKYIGWSDGSEKLHDLSLDRAEDVNLVDDPDYSDTLQSMRHLMLQRLLTTEDNLPIRHYPY